VSQNGNAERLRNAVDHPRSIRDTTANRHPLTLSLVTLHSSATFLSQLVHLLPQHPTLYISPTAAMGNLCSKSSNKPDPFSGQGRVVGTSSDNLPRSSAPVPPKIIANTPGRPLGGANSNKNTGNDDGTTPDPRSAAAKAAEVRAHSYHKCSASLLAAAPSPC
jgi:hypothetical protein